jgi:hypothetical protein
MDKNKELKFLNYLASLLGKNQDKLPDALKKLNKSLSKKREIFIPKTVKELEKELIPDDRDNRGELEEEVEEELLSFIYAIRFELNNINFDATNIINEINFFDKFEYDFYSEIVVILDHSLYFSFDDFAWVVFCHKFYPNLEVFKENKEKVEAMKAIVEAGNAYVWLSKTKMIVLPFPEIYLDSQRRLHNEKGYACKILGRKTYWIHGKKYSKKEWLKVIK